MARNKTFSIINILGLVVGTICCLYIVMYVTVEYSYDKQHKLVADIYRVNSTFIAQGTRNNNATSSPPIAPAMKRDFPEVQQFTRVVTTGSVGAKQHLLFGLAGALAMFITLCTVSVHAIGAAMVNPVNRLRAE